MPQDYTARLPPELLQHVTSELRLAELLPLLATSRRWREIALNAPAYWESIDLTVASAGAVNFSITRLSRTLERPFALAVRVHTEWSALERTFPAIRSHLHHVTGLDLQVHAAHASILLHALCLPANLLQMFYFVAFSVVTDVLLAEFPAELFGGHAPSLRMVSFYNVSFPEDKAVSAFQQAQRLQLGYYTWPDTTVPNVFPHFPNLQQFILQGLFISLHPVFLDPSSWAAVDFVWLKLDRTAPAVELDLAPLYSVRRVCVDFPLRQHILPLFAHIRGPAKLVFSDTGDNLAVHLVDDDDSTMMRTMSKDLLESPDSFRYDLFTLPDIAHRIVAISIDCSLWDVIVGLLPELPLVDLLQVVFDDAIPSLDAIFECPQLTVLIFRSGAECRRKLFSGTFMEFAAGRLRGVCFPIEIRLVNIQLDLDTDDVARVEEFNRFFSLIRELYSGGKPQHGRPQELLTDEVVFRNTSSNGANWLEFLTGCFTGPPARCRRQLWDFAFAGADIDDSLLPRHHDYTVSLTNQVAQYLAYARGVIPRSDARRTIVAWWIGINDTGDTINREDIGDFDAFWEREMDLYFEAVQRVHDTGLARAHLFVNVPPGQRSPGTLGSGNATRVEVHASRIAGFNAALARRIALFERANRPSAQAITFDAHRWFNRALDDAAQLGFSNTTGFCHCKDPAGFFWYDSGHPTEAVHRLIARAVESTLRAA